MHHGTTRPPFPRYILAQVRSVGRSAVRLGPGRRPYRHPMMLVSSILAGLLCTASGLVCTPSALGYNPPVDTAEGVTVRIEAPERVATAGDAIDVAVIVENASAVPISADLRLGLIDGWQATPNVFSSIQVSPGGSQRLTCRVQSTAESYAAHYPIHVWAKVQRPNAPQLELHPIAILVVERALDGHRRPNVAWKPIPISPNSAFALEQARTFRAVMQVFGKPVEISEVGWDGRHPEHWGSLTRSHAALNGTTKPCLAIHPPWRDGQVGTLAAEFPIQLPPDLPVTLHFALGMIPEGQSDGVTFRARVLPLDAPEGQWGEVVWERHTTAKTWESHTVDLAKYAGTAIRLQLESHPGPKNNTGWDSSFWAEPTIVVGTPPQPDRSPPVWDKAIDLGRGKVFDLECEYLALLGNRGLLNAAVGFRTPSGTVWFRGFQITVESSRLDGIRSALMLQGVAIESPGGPGSPLKVRHHFVGEDSAFDLVGQLAVADGVLKASFKLENAPQPVPWEHTHIEDAAVGAWSQPLEKVFAGTGNVLIKPGRYQLSFDGHRLSTSFVGFEFTSKLSIIQACDVPPTRLDVDPKERHFSLHVAPDCQFTFIPASQAWEGAKKWREVNGLRPAGGVQQAAGRFVFDLWGGHYRDSADQLRRAFRYGLTHSMVIWHNWQRWGYDYRLPEICPPNPDLGSLEDCRYLIESCREAGVLFGLHDNYIDFYPDAEGFSYRDRIAFHADRTPVLAWFNEGRQARSYRYRADQVEPFLQANLHWIREHLGPTAYFIDVWSSVGPYDYWTSDGTFFDRVFTRNTWGRHFAWIRDLLGNNAPQISESGHDQLIGWLDGAQTNHLRVGNPLPGYYQWSVWNWECQDAERIPWFDAAHHDRFVLHGAGYEGRYAAGLDTRMHGMYSDDYITTEVLTGHPPMVSRPFSEGVVRKYWLLAPLMQALAIDRIESVEFVEDDIHRQHVRWERGGEVWCNRGEKDWTVQGHVLPQYGFLAKVPTPVADSSQHSSQFVEAGIVRIDGTIVEFSRSPQWSYFNGRNGHGGIFPGQPSSGAFRDLGGRRLELELIWRLGHALPENYVQFSHFCDQKGDIAFQGRIRPIPDRPLTGTLQTVLEASVPEDAKPGDSFDLRIGAYDPQSGRRLSLAGPNDGGNRVRLGKLTVGEDGKLTWTPSSERADPLQERINPAGKIIDFGEVATAQGIRLTREKEAVRVTALPHDDTVVAAIRLGSTFGEPFGGVRADYRDEVGEVTRTENLTLHPDGSAVLELQPGEFDCLLYKQK